MPFNTISYFLFLPGVFLLHHFTPGRFRWLVLLGASFIFYASLKAPHLIAVLLFITTFTYFTGIWIAREKCQRRRKFIFIGGISTNVLALVILKYLSFLTQNLNHLLQTITSDVTVPVSKMIITIGTSYFVFQAISYLIDVYLENEEPEPHFGYFALYLSFFPKLLQGPIERKGDLLPQFKEPYLFNYDNVRYGLLLFSWGLLQKIVIADRLALMANQVFDNVHAYSGISLLLGVYYYSLQIFFDFSGYTDMALGSARLFNIKLTPNFNNPYAATSVADFWRRWHISFSRWILDYIFKPLQMTWRYAGRIGTASALLVTFSVCGIWHGASWGFIVWGVIHGLYMASSIFYKPIQKKIYAYFNINTRSMGIRLWQVFCVFNLVSFAWIFFRSKNIDDAIYIITNIFPQAITTIVTTSIYDVAVGKINLSLGVGLYNLVVVFIFIMAYLNVNTKISTIICYGKFKRWLLYIALTTSLVLLGYYGKSAEFIYFKF